MPHEDCENPQIATSAGSVELIKCIVSSMNRYKCRAIGKGRWNLLFTVRFYSGLCNRYFLQLGFLAVGVIYLFEVNKYIRTPKYR